MYLSEGELQQVNRTIELLVQLESQNSALSYSHGRKAIHERIFTLSRLIERHLVLVESAPSLREVS